MNAAWLRADWPVPGHVVAGTTLRGGGVSRGEFESLNLASHVGDDLEAVSENRRRFLALCGLPGEPAWLRQVHGTRVVRAEDALAGAEADGVVARSGGLVCAVLTADCLPVLLASQDGAEIAAAHAGWRGLGAGILESTIAALETPPAGLIAWLGPAISKPAYEVGAEVREHFVRQSKEAADCFSQNDRGRWQADLVGLATLRLKASGVTRVFGGAHCTHGEPDRFFSYRRDGNCGRVATFVFRRGERG